MPEINPVLSQVGIGFAAFLAPPGPEVIRFTVGQPDFGTPQPVVDEAKAALDRGETAYTRPQGTVALCDAVEQPRTRPRSPAAACRLSRLGPTQPSLHPQRAVVFQNRAGRQ